MNVLQRLSTTVEAMLHDLFDSAERKNPIGMLNQYVRQAEKETEKVGKLVTRQYELKEKIAAELREVEGKLAKRMEQVALAEAAGEQDLIDFTQAEVQAYTSRKALLQQSYEEAAAEHTKLEQQFEQMKHRLQDMKVRQLQLMSKENVAHANYRMQEVSSKQADMHTGKFDDAADYIDRLAFKVNHNYEVTTFERRLAALEQKQ
ncbi:PspA/IM30 family protein [Lysinibacillus sp. KU-BSD001]|uniref:PspA/IM30 family protein n=1 Tax=Lysinibacillus sp. KU-BSD001 TaxID=3141328 RepID=UPI0036E2F7D2